MQFLSKEQQLWTGPSARKRMKTYQLLRNIMRKILTAIMKMETSTEHSLGATL
jgi:hypothetical protein